MKIKSITDSIKSVITNNATNDVIIDDRSLMAELLAKESDDCKEAYTKGTRFQFESADGTPLKGKKWLAAFLRQFWRYDSARTCPLTSAMIRLLWRIFELFVTLFYLLCTACSKALGGKTKDLRRSPRFNFILFFTVIVFYIWVIVAMVSFLLKDVLLFNPDRSVNDNGAIVMKQPCGQEHYIYLLSAATYWNNTGIELLEGDHFSISTSGAFYGDIVDLDSAARTNQALKYKLNNSAYTQPVDSASRTMSRLCMYHAEDGRFGSILYQIHGDRAQHSYSQGDTIASDETATIKQLNSNMAGKEGQAHEVEQGGCLYLSVNDIYLDERTTEMLSNKDADDSYKQLIKGLRISSGKKPNSVKMALTDLSQKCPEVWFKDNIGEILVNITVYRQQTKLASAQFRKMENIYQSLTNENGIPQWSGILWKLLILIGMVASFLFLDHRIGHREQ